MFIFSNLATSLDGKIATSDRRHLYLGTPYDRKHMMVLRAKCQAIVVGASTLRAFKREMITPLVTQSRQPLNVIVSSMLDGLDESWPFFKSKRVERVLFVSERAPAARVRRFEKSCQIVRLKKGKPLARQVAQTLKTLGVDRILLEGGGALMWNFASANMIDEYNVTLTPNVVGGADAPTMVEGSGFTAKQIQRLKLKQCRRVGDELYLVYQKKKKS